MMTESIIKTYFGAWVSGDQEKARSLVHNDLRFRSPQDGFDSAEDFFETCWHLNEGFAALDVVQEVYDESSGYIAYRVDGMVNGEFVRLREGKITEIYVTFGVTA